MNSEYTTKSDEELARSVQQGEKEVFGELMRRYENKLSRYGKKFLSNKDNIEDIVQDIFIKAYEHIQGFDPSLTFSSWIYRIAHNTFVNALRKQKITPILYIDFDIFTSHPIYEDPTQKEKEDIEIKKMIDSGIEKLKPKYKEVMILHYIEDLSYKEMSDILQVPLGTVGIRVKRAKDELKKHIKI